MTSPTDDDGWGEASGAPKVEEVEPTSHEQAKAVESRDPTPVAPPAKQPEPVDFSDIDQPPPKRRFWQREKQAEDSPATPGMDATEPTSGRRTLAMIGVAALAMVAFVGTVVSFINSHGYYMVCEPTQIVAEKGRWLPWGHTRLGGEEWQPVALPKPIPCNDQKFDLESDLRREFALILRNQTSAVLADASAEEPPDEEQLQVAAGQLQQALRLLRMEPEEKHRVEVERLQGDVEYWRAAGEIREAMKRLDAAADRFKDAAARDPRHRSDAEQWGAFAHSVASELNLGPPALRPEVAAPPGSATPFAGTNSPLDAGSETGSELDGGPVPEHSEPRRPPDAGPQDAGASRPPPSDSISGPDAGPPPLPTGGVLL